MDEVVLLLGCRTRECEAFELHAQAFGWSVHSAESLQDLRRISKIRNLIAIFFDDATLGLSWEEALKLVREIAPVALPIACHKFSEPFPWPDLAAAGAFHAVPLPFDPRELRQSLGFVWGAMKRRSCNVIPIATRDCA